MLTKFALIVKNIGPRALIQKEILVERFAHGGTGKFEGRAADVPLNVLSKPHERHSNSIFYPKHGRCGAARKEAHAYWYLTPSTRHPYPADRNACTLDSYTNRGVHNMPTLKLTTLLTAKTRIAFLSLALLMTAGMAAAQTASLPNILMLPSGSAPVCETAQGAQLPACNGFLPANGPFNLLIKPTNSSTTAYRYTILATMPDGSTRVFTGNIARADDPAGYTSTSMTLDCDPVSVDVNVAESVALVQTAQ